MEFDHEIICTDRNGIQNHFKYSLEKSDEDDNIKWIFKVMSSDLNANDWFEFHVTVIDSNIGKVTMMTNKNMIQYRGKGITERMIEESANVLNLTIISSTNNPQMKKLSTEWRSLAADKIWERLITKGRAIYNQEDDFYTFINSQ